MSDRLTDIAQALGELNRRERENRLGTYKPYPKQQLFHDLGYIKRERALIAGTQLGKTYSASMETAMHASGRYPDWWQGKRFAKAPRIWVVGEGFSLIRETSQKLLLGENRHGTGSIPKDAIQEITMSRGIPLSVDKIAVKHASGGISTIVFKSFDQGREKLQGDTVDAVWVDEEPDMDIYSEILARTSASKGIVYCTFTPLKGMSEVVRRFLNEVTADRAFVNMSIDDAGHFTDAERASVIAAYPAHEREARAKGVPMLGQGRVFTTPEDEFVIAPFEIPRYFTLIWGLDIGIDHPTAAALVAWDRDRDIAYLINEHRQANWTVAQHASILRRQSPDIPIAWPHDAAAREHGSGKTVSQLYREEGLNMLSSHAQFEDGGNSVEAGIMMMDERLRSDRLKVFGINCPQWLEEYRLYHRKDGKIVKQNDDLISASRYGLMMLRSAKPVDRLGRKRRKRGHSIGYADYDVLNH